MSASCPKMQTELFSISAARTACDHRFAYAINRAHQRFVVVEPFWSRRARCFIRNGPDMKHSEIASFIWSIVEPGVLIDNGFHFIRGEIREGTRT